MEEKEATLKERSKKKIGTKTKSIMADFFQLMEYRRIWKMIKEKANR